MLSIPNCLIDPFSKFKSKDFKLRILEIPKDNSYACVSLMVSPYQQQQQQGQLIAKLSR